MWNIVFLVTGAIFIALLLIIFFSKEIIDSKENKYFKTLIIINMIEYCIEIPLQLFVRGFGIESMFVDIFAKIYLVSIFTWFSFFSIYTFIICLDKNDENKYEKNFLLVKNINLTLLTIGIFVLILLPFNKFHKGDIMYIYGGAVDVLKVFLGIYMVVWIMMLIKNIKNIRTKKYAPIFLVLLLLLVNVVLQSVDPSILIASMIGTFICYIMAFTIENPDIKMINELEVAREQADKANRAKTDFLSSMSHEIRTPLNAIVGFSDCIMDATTLEEAKENAKDIVSASDTLLEIVNGILDISKIEAGKLEIINSPYDAGETFLELAKLITPKMKEKGLDFTYTIAPDLPKTLYGDHANLKKIVTNLLSNACKYTEKGFVHYEVNCINSGNLTKLIISVEDSGRGIKKDSVDKMFTKFQRLDEDRNTTIEGTGLGLAITKQLIELMGGKIIVHTVYGEGSKFTVVLNQRIEAVELKDKKKAKTTLDLHDVRILIVDDTPLNLKVSCKLLQKYGANQLVTADSGFECFQRIRRGEVYDVILLDDMMPKMSGVETLKKLKELPGFKIPTVALTANAITGMREKYLADGFDDFLAKPIEKDQMIEVLNQVLGRSVTEEISVEEVQEVADTPAIRGEVIPDVEDYDKANEERNKIIPVEDNIEEILGEKLDRNYVEEKETVETLEEEPEEVVEDNKPDLIPVVDIDTPVEKEVVYDRVYLESMGVDVNHSLELLGDMDMFNMTIKDFSNDVEEKWKKINEYKDNDNMSEYAVLVHSLKSDCKYLGFMALADIAYQHELKSKENDSDYVKNNFNKLEEEYNKVLDIVKNYVKYQNI